MGGLSTLMAWREYRPVVNNGGRRTVAQVRLKEGSATLNTGAIRLVPHWKKDGTTTFRILIDEDSGMVGIRFGEREPYPLNKGSHSSNSKAIAAAIHKLGGKDGDSFFVEKFDMAGIDLVIRVREGKG